MSTIDIALFDGVEELDFVGPLEVLRTAGIDTRLVTLAEPLEIRCANGLQVQADTIYSPGAQVLLVPGGGWLARAEAGAWAEVQKGAWAEAIKTAAGEGVVMAGVCTGVMILAHAGVIGARPAVTHTAAIPELEALGVKVERRRVVDAGGLITAGGVACGIDLALTLVARLKGLEAAQRQAEYLEYPWTPPHSEPAAAPTGHTITTEPLGGTARAVFNGTVVAESDQALLLREAGLPPVVYFPPDDVRWDHFTPTELSTRCPFKGDASYWTVEVGDRRSESIAWSYLEPLPGRADIARHVAFYAKRLDALETV
jgi:uncharacterized protein (DUF427 family)/putative intracellular protease/amidase